MIILQISLIRVNKNHLFLGPYLLMYHINFVRIKCLKFSLYIYIRAPIYMDNSWLRKIEGMHSLLKIRADILLQRREK